MCIKKGKLMGTGYLLYILDGIYIYIFYKIKPIRECEILSWESFGRALCGKKDRDKAITLPSFS